MTSQWLFTGLVVLVGVERLIELFVSRRHAAWAFSRGAIERGRSHYPVMVALHTGLLVGCLAEVWVTDRPFIPALGWTMLVLFVLAEVLRWWCIATLGKQWNTRVIVVPGLPLVRRGPYRFMPHPNYVAVVLDGITLPLVHTAWVTALLFTVGNAALLMVRIRCEDAALREIAAPARTPRGVSR